MVFEQLLDNSSFDHRSSGRFVTERPVSELPASEDSIKEPKQSEHCVKYFAQCFDQHFQSDNTILKPGAEEPFYQAAKEAGQSSIIYSNQDFFSSALHEIAHWCIAGSERRQLDDYGYWYEPDGRDHQQQELFYKVEAKPQALEWAFSLAANIPFRISLDNLASLTNNSNKVGKESEQEIFRNKVYAELERYFKFGFPKRAQRVIALLSTLYSSQQPIRLPQKKTCLL